MNDETAAVATAREDDVPPVQAVDTGAELADDELEQVVGGLARVWLPAPVARGH